MGLVPEPGHFHVHEGSGPGNQGKACYRFEAGEETQHTEGFDISVTHSSVIGEREINTIQQAAVNIAAECAEIAVGQHQEERDAENPDLHDVGTDSTEYANNDFEARLYRYFRNELREKAQHFIVNANCRGHKKTVYEKRGEHGNLFAISG